jgi:methylated-DNA-[protein]-cysteine S-methyltransferase
MTPAAGWTRYESPLGPLTVVAGPSGVRGLSFPGREPRLEETARREIPAVAAQLEEYFAGERRHFDLELELLGTPLQRAVWARLREIPYGATTTYGQLADEVEDSLYPRSFARHERIRAAAAAIGRTPTPILVPCHRVIAAAGSLTGYLGGLQRKQALLELEGRVATGLPPAPAWSFRQTAML